MVKIGNKVNRPLMMALQAETCRKKRGHVLKGEIKAAIKRYTSMYVLVLALIQQNV
jgi:hypothetical protein